MPSISVQCNKHRHYREVVNEATYNRENCIYTKAIHVHIQHQHLGQHMDKHENYSRKRKVDNTPTKKNISKILIQGEKYMPRAK